MKEIELLKIIFKDSPDILELLNAIDNEIERLQEHNIQLIKREELNCKIIKKYQNIIKEVREYIEENSNSDSYTTLTSGKITDIGYCLVAFEDILKILDKVSDKE